MKMRSRRSLNYCFVVGVVREHSQGPPQREALVPTIHPTELLAAVAN